MLNNLNWMIHLVVVGVLIYIFIRLTTLKFHLDLIKNDMELALAT